MGPLNLFSRFTRCSSSISGRTLLPSSHLYLYKHGNLRPVAHRQIYPPWSQSRTMIQSSENSIREMLALLPEVKKWGWVIYRCTYGDDTAWKKFRDRIEVASREYIAQSDAPEIAERLEWTWIEDAATLDGVSTMALRERFNAWVADEVARQPGDYHPWGVSRFNKFIKVDEESLDSLAEVLSQDMDWSDDGFVKLVDATWEPLGEQEDEEQEDNEWPGEVWEPIEGCTEKDVGWMRITPLVIGPNLYEVMSGDSVLWYAHYERPPAIYLG